MGFRFSLATVLRFLESVERREELALQAILAEIARTRRAIEELTMRIEAAHRARHDALQQPIAAFEIQSMCSEATTAADLRSLQLDKLAKLEQQRMKQLSVYRDAHRNRQMLTEMRTREQSAHERERNRTQQKFLDDMFAARGQRN